MNEDQRKMAQGYQDMLWSLAEKEQKLANLKELDRKENETYLAFIKRKDKEKADYMKERATIEAEKQRSFW